jgi:hypothetical protein
MICGTDKKIMLMTGILLIITAASSMWSKDNQKAQMMTGLQL